MPYSVLQPPKDEAAFAALGKEIYEAGKAFGLNLDPEGFLFSWANGTRVLVERDAEGKIVGLVLMALGKRWIQSDFTATVLYYNGSEGLLEFTLQIAHALGATSLYRETGMLTRNHAQKLTTHEVTEHHLQ